MFHLRKPKIQHVVSLGILLKQSILTVVNLHRTLTFSFELSSLYLRTSDLFMDTSCWITFYKTYRQLFTFNWQGTFCIWLCGLSFLKSFALMSKLYLQSLYFRSLWNILHYLLQVHELFDHLKLVNLFVTRIVDRISFDKVTSPYFIRWKIIRGIANSYWKYDSLICLLCCLFCYRFLFPFFPSLIYLRYLFWFLWVWSYLQVALKVHQ